MSKFINLVSQPDLWFNPAANLEAIGGPGNKLGGGDHSGAPGGTPKTGEQIDAEAAARASKSSRRPFTTLLTRPGDEEAGGVVSSTLGGASSKGLTNVLGKGFNPRSLVGLFR